MAKKLVQYLGTGRRKSSVARVYLRAGKGNITINGRAFEDYIPSAAVRLDVLQPLELTENVEKFDVLVNGLLLLGQLNLHQIRLLKHQTFLHFQLIQVVVIHLNELLLKGYNPQMHDR